MALALDAQGTGSVQYHPRYHQCAHYSWSDTSITVTVPTGVANCAVQQQAQYGGSTAQCGQLVITAGNGKQSIDTVTVTIGGKLRPTSPPRVRSRPRLTPLRRAI
jgi:hypothetical protein